jgi:hypothetical protein
MDPNQDKKPPIPDHSDARFFYLLLVILVTLAGLWIIERGNRTRAERDLVNLHRQLDGEKGKTQRLSEMLVHQALAQPVVRKDLATTKMKWDGRERTVLLLSAKAGRKLGFQPDDVVWVTESPAGEPAKP